MQTCFCLNPDCDQPHNEQGASHCQTCGSKLLLRDRYRAYKKLGQGGFGATFLARDRDLPSQPWRAIKQLRLAKASPQVAALSKELFMREAQVLELLGEHSQIPNLFAYFEEGGHFYLVQEFILGPTLASELHRHGPMTEEKVRQILQEVLLILSYVHSQETVHRDIKPANLIRRKEDGRLVLIDFGAVKQMGIQGLEEKPSSATAIRSLGFSPPEQVAGQAVGPPSDLYALGATCLNLLTKESPTRFFDHKQGCWTWREHLYLDEGFAEILDTLLRPAIAARFPSATDALRALQGLTSSVAAATVKAPNQSSLDSVRNPISSNWSARRPSTTSPKSSLPPPSPSPHSSASPLSRPARRSATPAAPIPQNRSNASTPASSPRSIAPKPDLLRSVTSNLPSGKSDVTGSLEGANLSDRFLANENLAGRNLRKANLRGTNLSGANLQGADLRGVQFCAPQPIWQQVLLNVLRGSRLIVSVVGGTLSMVLAGAAVGFAVYKFSSITLLGIAAGVGAAAMVGYKVWAIAGSSLGSVTSTTRQPRRLTQLRHADLRGAKLDSSLRHYARRQGARLD
jgi:serine/threonine-protein kinase